VPMEEAIRIICRSRMVIKDALGNIHTLGVDPKDLAWDLLPVQSVDTTWNLGAGGIVLDHKEGLEGQGEAPLTLVEEVGSFGVPLDAVEMEQVVIGLGTFSGVLVVGGALGAGVLCYWRCRSQPAGGIAQDDELGDEKLRSEVQHTIGCAPSRLAPSCFRELHEGGS
jgi:hypothetical protein